MFRKMRIFYKFLLLLYFVLPQLALGVNSITRHRRSATKKCGNPGNLLNKMLIFGDKSFILGDFPWMVALTKNVRHQVPGFFGAGTLVSSRHVITGKVQSQILWFLVIRIFNILIGFF